MPPSFALPPMIQNTLSNDRSAFSAASALVAFKSLMKRTFPLRPTSSKRCGSPGKLRRPCATRSRSNPRGPSAATAAAAFWPLCSPRNEAIPARPAIRVERPPPRRMRQPPSRTMPSSIAVLVTETHAVFRPAFMRSLGNGTCKSVVDSDHREIGIFHQLCLDRGIIFHRAVAVQVIWRDIQKHAHGWD